MAKTKAELEKENKTMRNKLREVVAERDGLKEEIKQLVEEMKEEQKSHEASLSEVTNWYEEMSDKYDNLEAEHRAMKEEQKSLHENYVKEIEKAEILKDSNDRLMADYSKANTHASKLETYIDDVVNVKLRNASQTIKELKKYCEELTDSNNELRRVCQQLTDIGNKEIREKAEILVKLDVLESKWNEHTKISDEQSKIAEELSSDNMRLQSEIADYLEKIRELQNELTTKETSLEYFEKGLRSAEREVVESRKTNRNLLNYIHILAAQDNPNLPDNFTY